MGMAKKGYRFLEHMSDALIEAYGKSLEEAFENAGRGLMDTMVRLERVEEKMEERLEVQGGDLESLLYNWLEVLLVKVSSEGRAYSSFHVKISERDGTYNLDAVARGEDLNVRKHEPKVEVKAVTYHLMEIRRSDGHVGLRFLLDL